VTEQARSGTYTFDRFELQAGERRLLVGGQPAILSPRAFDVLLTLIEQAGHLVTKDQLMAAVWPKLVVEDNNLQQQISVLRKLLGQQAIATVPGRGYRFTLESRSAQPSPNRPLATATHNLPRWLTNFIGREDDLLEYARVLQQTRLLTLAGIGGSGKTRLAIKLAETLLPTFGDGVWLIDFSSLSEPHQVAMLIASVLGLREESGRLIADTVEAHLCDKCALLIFDNCENVLMEAAALAGRLLNATAQLRILATSREGLGLPAETMRAVRSLSLPQPGQDQDLGSIESSEAVRLFADRARLVAPEFELGAGNSAAAADICRRLDGIPLAIELAAARMKLLSVDQIRAKLSDRFRLLKGSGKGLTRHQTLDGVIQWSYEHLAADEQQVLRRLAVFAGGWTVPAAAAVVGESADELAMLELLDRLVDKSLVIIEREGQTEPRCRMLDTVRQFAQERLDETGEFGAIRTRHFVYFLALVEDARQKLGAGDAKPWLRQIDIEWPNIVEAHAACGLADDRAEQGLRLVAALFSYLGRRGLIQFGRRLFVEALARAGAQPQTQARASVLNAAGEFALAQGAHDEALAYFQESAEIAGAQGNRAAVGVALFYLGVVATQQGDMHGAKEQLEQSLAIAREMEDASTTMLALNNLGELYRTEGDVERASALYEEALALSRQRDLINLTAVILLNLAKIAIERHDHRRAHGRITEAAAYLDRSASRFQWSTLLDTAFGLAVGLGDFLGAAQILGASEAIYETTGRQREDSDQQFLAPLMAEAKAQVGDTAFQQACAKGRAQTHEEAVAEVHAWLSARR